MAQSSIERSADGTDIDDSTTSHRKRVIRTRAPWRSPDDQPRYARPTLLALTAVATLLFTWRLNDAGYNSYYANAVRSMTQSWTGFLFGSFDSGNAISIDKVPGFLWPQAVSARLFGFHPWSLQLPQVIEGIACVLLLYRVVRLWAGVPAALLAVAAFTLTPATYGVFRTPTEEPAFTLLLLLAAAACQRAALTGRLRPLVMSGIWVGLAFHAKMLEAWAVLPALAVSYLVAAPVELRRRLRWLLVAGAVTVAVSASWVLLATVTPAQHRPYIDGTTNNSPLAMVVGYNFLNRFESIGLSASSTGSVPSGPAARVVGSPMAGARTSGEKAAERTLVRALREQQRNDPAKMVGSTIASQTGWLYPVGLLALILGLAWRRREPRTDALRFGHLMWGLWFLTFFLLFSVGSIGGHLYYMGVVDLSLAALAGAGAVAFWQAFREGGRRAAALPAAIVTGVAWSAWLAWAFPEFESWLGPTVILFGAAALAGLLWRGGSTPGRARRRFTAMACAAALLFGPTIWVLSLTMMGSNGMGAVGPAKRRVGTSQLRGELAADFGITPEPAGSQGGRQGGQESGQSGGNLSATFASAFGGASTKMTPEQWALLDYVKRDGRGSRYQLATADWNTAAPYILRGNARVLAMGGYSGRTPYPTLPGFQRLVATGQVRYVIVNGLPPGMQEVREDSAPVARVTAWVRAACTAIPAAAYGAAEPEPDQSQAGQAQAKLIGLLSSLIGRTPDQLLYRCG